MDLTADAGCTQIVAMAHRIYTDSAGIRWEVWDVRPSVSLDGVSPPGSLLSEEAAEGWLTFQASHQRRRFYMVPEGWDQFTDSEMELLCKHAVPVSPNPLA